LPFKKPHTAIKHIKDIYYQYAVTYHYDPDRKHTIPKSGVLLGKITEHDGFVPSPKNTLRQTPLALPRVDIKTFGLYALFEHLLKDEIPSLEAVFGPERAHALLTFAMMRWAYQSSIKRVLAYQVHDYSGEHWCPDIRLSDKYLTGLLRFTGENREAVLSWMRGLLPRGNENFVLMDSTHVMSRAGCPQGPYSDGRIGQPEEGTDSSERAAQSDDPGGEGSGRIPGEREGTDSLRSGVSWVYAVPGINRIRV
jgi:hypothetical protein